MTEQEMLDRMVAPAGYRPSKPYRGGVIQILVTSNCNLSCYNCTQASNLRRPVSAMPPEIFEQAVKSLQGYWGVYGLFGGNPTVSKYFKEYCEILRKLVPYNQRGIWCNDPLTLENAQEMRRTFDPSISNLNCHLDQKAHDLFKAGWPESNVVGLTTDSRHSPPWVAIKDVMNSEEARELIASCDVNWRWSASLGMFRGQLRAWFCEIAMAQSILHQYDTKWIDDALHPDHPEAEPEYTYPDTGVRINADGSCQYDENGETVHSRIPWWQLGMSTFKNQVRKHCFSCGVPLRGYGELAQAEDGTEQVSATHAEVYKPKRPNRKVEIVTTLEQLGTGRIIRSTDYIGNSKR